MTEHKDPVIHGQYVGNAELDPIDANALRIAGDFDSIGQQNEVLRACAGKLEVLAEQHPEWFAIFEDSQAFSAPRSELLELLRAAPDPFAAGLVYGIFLMRQEMAVMTGREFI